MSDDTEVLPALERVAARYDVLLCDLWGCYHNGVAPYPAAVAALRAFRARGGAVILLTNAPRPAAYVRRHLDKIGAPADSFDTIVSSGDATREALAEGRFGRRLHVVGPDRDDMLWRDLDLEAVGLEAAEAILCTGLVDDTVETPDDYAGSIAAGVARGLPFVCANPDLVVDRAETRLYCAGALAERYAAAGGVVHQFGKPHAPIYRLALAAAERLRPGVSRARILAVGDGPMTDVAGAAAAGVDALFVSGGIAAAEVGDDPERPDSARLAAYLVRQGVAPRYAIGRLR